VSHPDTYDRMEKKFQYGELSKMDSKEIIRSDRATNGIDFFSRQNTETGLVALSFKVPFKFRQEFKLQALQMGVTMTELLVHAVEMYVDANRAQPSLNTDLRK
jgi:hypothetical protein